LIGIIHMKKLRTLLIGSTLILLSLIARVDANCGVREVKGPGGTCETCVDYTKA
jgi:hypothetical protein